MEDATFQRGLHVAALENTKCFICVNGVRIRFYLLTFDTQRGV